MTDDSGPRTLLVDACVFITLADLGTLDVLRDTDGRATMPQTVVEEITSEPAERELDRALDDWIVSSTLIRNETAVDGWDEHLETARTHLGRASDPEEWGGDVPLLAAALSHERSVVITDDKPLRKTCNILSIPVSGTIGLLIRAVECGDLGASEAKQTLGAMDEVGARLSVRLVRRAERLIDEAAET
ncbi:DUF3368 domain-containing protein [Natronorubrum daqingense]|uniref:Predicted nucleic acid-binding protein, contains PIN domain n=1 Tax=Natronorubrum daqingense TaxID=588898 RepID=A0A1N7CPG7_9EURY|nr:DUF3368 domain-containing protein [Natronorubrum daqingense]APX96997.1 hypothetical protein BB347_10405 [Natronorubrum daqingense]SIR65506.1 Predicted nucleic acid-binding protein, contains PIN domain [Natronorubrum daqingense]